MKKIIISVVAVLILIIIVIAIAVVSNKKTEEKATTSTQEKLLTSKEQREQELTKQLKNKEFHKPVDLPIEVQEKLKSSCNDFFSAFTRYDENGLATILGSRPEWKDFQSLAKGLKKYYGDVAEITIGEPFYVEAFTSNIYVPYKLRFKDGRTKEWQIAIRYYNENGGKLPSWYIDGGF